MIETSSQIEPQTSNKSVKSVTPINIGQLPKTIPTKSLIIVEEVVGPSVEISDNTLQKADMTHSFTTATSAKVKKNAYPNKDLTLNLWGISQTNQYHIQQLSKPKI